MKEYFYLAVVATAASFSIFHIAYSRISRHRRLLLITSILASAPAFAIIYNCLFGIPSGEWFLDWRAIPGTEIFAGALGAPLGVFLASERVKRFRYGDHMQLLSVAAVAILMLGVFLPQLYGSIDYSTLTNCWSGNVCLQSNNSTCVPSCFATILRLKGKRISERQLAEVMETTTLGTDDWGIKRGMRKLGYVVKLGHTEAIENAPVPCVLGVSVKGIPHVVVLMEKNPKGLLIGEPLSGPLRYSWRAFEVTYHPSGSYKTIYPITK